MNDAPEAVTVLLAEAVRDGRAVECRICEEIFAGVGHTLSQGGVCCDDCNLKWVMPLRMRGLHL